MNNTDGLPGPEARVREFLEALDQETSRNPGTEPDDLAWAVPDGGGILTLTASDLRDVLREFDALRKVHGGIMRHAAKLPAGYARRTRGPSETTLGPMETEQADAIGAVLHAVIAEREHLDATDPHATPDQVHARDIRDMTTEALQARYAELDEFHDGRASVDPRCGCSADNEGGSCYWDSTDEIDEELGRRGR